MATESPIQIIEASVKWGSTNMKIEDLGLLKGQRFQGRNSNLPPNRSGSAPPSIEGSFAAIENLMFRQNYSTLGPKGDTRISGPEEQLRADPSYFEYYWAHVNLNPRLPPPLVSEETRIRNVRGSGSNRRLKSFDESFNSLLQLDHSNLSTHKEESDDGGSPKQEDLPQPNPFRHEPNEEESITTISSSPSIDSTRGNMVINQPVNKSLSNRSQNNVSFSADISGIRNELNAISISNFPNLESQRSQRNPQIVSSPQTYVNMNQFLQNQTNFSSEVQPILQSSGFTPPHYPADPPYIAHGAHMYPNIMPAGYFPQHFNSSYAFNPNPSPVSPCPTGYLPNGPFATPFSNAFPSFISQSQSQTPGVSLQHFNNFYGHLGLQSLGNMGHVDLNSRRVGPTSPYYCGSPTNMDLLQITDSPFASPVIPGSPIGGGGYSGRGWKGHNGNYGINDLKTYSFLEELKSGKGRRLGLSHIYGHIVEFSVDQHGSRFIQQKLEVCSNEEKEFVFKEVIPHASKLIIDVFGNYVIQKFFEYGSEDQRRELGNKLEGQILTLSQQMYSCRVIQKALDVVDLKQKIKLVSELDGNVLKCVGDQNGNHVIQKCIESIPTENIKFVISSFRGQVAALSKHLYGCRVIQRVLEHSTDELQTQFVVDEILDSVYDLAQDQYGNYVTQYVLEGGKPEEISIIVDKLAGHIVQLSQHKFASNVIEKCLEYSDTSASKIMIEEIIGFADGNGNLLVMVKDQFANYVVQKVLQTCDSHQREALLGRIKIHLDSLKKYTYGKHIVARFEQLYGEENEASGS